MVPAVPFVLILSIGYFYFSTSLSQSVMAGAKRIVEDHRHMIESFLSERKADLVFIQESHTLIELSDPKALDRMYNRLQAQSDAFADFGVFDDDGIHMAYRGPYQLSGKRYADTEWFSAVMKNGFYISDVFLGYRKVPHFIIATSRRKNDQSWVIRATIDTQKFRELVERIRIGKTGEAYILNRDGIFQTQRRSGGNLLEKDSGFDGFPETASGVHLFFKEDDKGRNYFYATTTLNDNKWLLVVRQEKSDAFAALRTAILLIVLVAVFGGCIIIFAAFFFTDRIVSKMIDLDRQKDQLQVQLIRAGRLAELGEMSAGFAHEINNPLQIMKSEQSLMSVLIDDLKKNPSLEQSPEIEELEDSISQVSLQIGRCAKITQAILKFGRKSEPEKKRVNLAELLPDILAMIEKTATVNGIRIQTDIGDQAYAVEGDPAQLQQVLLNLINNAMDAVIRKHGISGGHVTIRIEKNREGTIHLQVGDNGEGINEENLKKIFTPFFTTKPVGEGTGLGLSICYGIISSMNGSLKVNSRPGSGTTFTVELPSSPDSGKDDE